MTRIRDRKQLVIILHIYINMDFDIVPTNPLINKFKFIETTNPLLRWIFSNEQISKK